MRLKTVILALLVAAAWAMPANAAIDPANPDWIMYRDTFGETTAEYYDYYQEVTQGETFTVHWVVNRNPPLGTGYQIRAYVSAFWWDPAVVDNLYNGPNHPTPNYTWTWLGSITTRLRRSTRLATTRN